MSEGMLQGVLVLAHDAHAVTLLRMQQVQRPQIRPVSQHFCWLQHVWAEIYFKTVTLVV